MYIVGYSINGDRVSLCWMPNHTVIDLNNSIYMGTHIKYANIIEKVRE